MGHAHATDLLLTLRKVEAAEVIGLVHRVVAPQDLASAARARALTLSTEVPPRSAGVMKQQLWEAPSPWARRLHWPTPKW